VKDLYQGTIYIREIGDRIEANGRYGFTGTDLKSVPLKSKI
jgi:hypothetical protein